MMRLIMSFINMRGFLSVHLAKVILIFVLFVLVSGVTSICMGGLLPMVEESFHQEELVDAETGDILRFHVKANSNSPADQEIKNYLARKIIQIFEPVWDQCESIEELRLLLSENGETMEDTAREILVEKGFPNDVHVYLEKGLFPARFYAGKFYPPGEYEALYMVIGEGTGENWWCVLFPPLCFAVVPSPSVSIESADSEQAGQKAEINFAESSKNDDFENKDRKKDHRNVNIKIRFWVIELFQKLRI